MDPNTVGVAEHYGLPKDPTGISAGLAGQVMLQGLAPASMSFDADRTLSDAHAAYRSGQFPRALHLCSLVRPYKSAAPLSSLSVAPRLARYVGG